MNNEQNRNHQAKQGVKQNNLQQGETQKKKKTQAQDQKNNEKTF